MSAPSPYAPDRTTDNGNAHWGAPGTKVIKMAPPSPVEIAEEEIAEIAQSLSKYGLSVSPTPSEARETNDIEYVANSINRLRHLDLKKIVEEMFGDTMPKDTAEAMDKAATWAINNVYPKVAP